MTSTQRAKSASQIIRAIGCDALTLHRGEGYWYFMYSTENEYETNSVYEMYLSNMSLEKWVEYGSGFVKQMEAGR